jgi:polyribonucleotide nucleotidyltransferase
MWASNEELMYCWKKLSELKPLTKPDNISTGKVKFGTAYELAVTSFNEALEDDASFTLKEPSSYNKAKTVLDEGINSTVEEKIDALTKIASQLEKTYKIDKVRVEDLKNKPEYRLYYRILQAIASLRGVTYR